YAIALAAPRFLCAKDELSGTMTEKRKRNPNHRDKQYNGFRVREMLTRARCGFGMGWSDGAYGI
ncbi:MAG: hypothetical protein LBS35_05605, partial [Synergistaceae bacterium]|nr:hypothetical protein [Synergistaceae bacterium]